MLRLQMLPAACGDCLWLEYGAGAERRIVIIDGGVRDTAQVLRRRIEAARRERNAATLEVELLVVTHIDNDHILGIIELLQDPSPALRVKDVWFNGKPQLVRLPPPAAPVAGPKRITGGNARGRPADLMGGSDDDARDDEGAAPADVALSASPADLLGPQQGDQLSALLPARHLPWNQHRLWNGAAVMVPDSGDLPAATLEGGLRLTVLGPTLARLHKLCAAWGDVLSGKDEPAPASATPADLLGRRDTWPPVWKDREKSDSSDANGSSIALLAEYGAHALLLAGDAHAPDLTSAVERVCRERKLPAGAALPLSAFKLAHHASENNLTRALLDAIDCSRYLVSTDGSVHRHPDHQALLRILRYSKRAPVLLFNHDCDTTRPWQESKADVVGGTFQDYTVEFPANPAEGCVLDLG